MPRSFSPLPHRPAISDNCPDDFNKDQVYRRWAANHGGVYVPVSASTRPSPYLVDVPERDVTTPSGRKLTLMNPAWIIRQVQELGREPSPDEIAEKGPHMRKLLALCKKHGVDRWSEGWSLEQATPILQKYLGQVASE